MRGIVQETEKWDFTYLWSGFLSELLLPDWSVCTADCLSNSNLWLQSSQLNATGAVSTAPYLCICYVLSQDQIRAILELSTSLSLSDSFWPACCPESKTAYAISSPHTYVEV